jgi:glycosyltransferase involved in cell wall biosynthesis
VRNWLGASLAALIPQCLRDGIELIVARAGVPSAMEQLGAAYPYARIISVPPRSTIAELRRAGLIGASGDIVALLDDTDDRAIPDASWLEWLKWRPSGGSGSDNYIPVRSSIEPTDAVAQGAGQFVPYSSRISEKTRQPYLSVVVPVHQGGDALRHSLETLCASDLSRSEWELIVVDDASTDETALIAADYADVVVRLPGKPRGPAYARNRGFEFARGEYIAFIDADVCVHRNTLAEFVLVLSREPEVSAVFGSFDTNPPARGLVSQYRNLLSHYYHQAHPGPAETFWASCGAIRRSVFAAAGMFDEWRFPRRQVEDFELGYQLRARGQRIVLRPEIQATHLGRWTLHSMIAADLQDRSVPWMRIFAKRGASLGRRKERLRRAKTINTLLTWLGLALALGALIADRPWLWLGAGACIVLVLMNDRAQHRFFARERGVAFAIAAVPLQLLSYVVNGLAVTVGWALRQLLGDPAPHPTIEAFAEVGVKMWPPVPSKRSETAVRSSQTS